MMRTLLVGLSLMAMAHAQDPAPKLQDRPLAKVQDPRKAEIDRWIEWLASNDPELRDFAARKLVEAGKDAVPSLEKLLAAKGAVDVYRVLKEIEAPKFQAARSWAEPELIEFDLKKDLPKVDRSDVEKYVYSKLAEATALYKQKMFERAYHVAKAMLLLEPTSVYSGKLQQLAMVCDNMVAQTSLIRSSVTSPKPGAIVGEKAEFALRMENVYKNGLKVGFPGTEGLVVVEVICDNLDCVSGTTTIENQHLELKVEPQIDIAMGAQWEKAFEVDTAAYFSNDKENLRRFTVGAWCQPGKLDVGFGNQARRLIFMPVSIWAVPKKYEHVLENPIKSFREAVKAGTTNEVFIAAMLSPPTDRDEVIETLIGLMEQSNSVAFKAISGRMLTFLTEQRLGDDPRAWKEWRERSKLPEPKEPRPKNGHKK